MLVNYNYFSTAIIALRAVFYTTARPSFISADICFLNLVLAGRLTAEPFLLLLSDYMGRFISSLPSGMFV